MASSAPSTSGVKTSPPISVNYSTLAYSLNTVVRAVKTTLGGLDSLGTDLGVEIPNRVHLEPVNSVI